MDGERGLAPMKGAAGMSDPIKIEAPGLVKQQQMGSANLKMKVDDSTEKNLERANNLLQEIENERLEGYQLDGKDKSNKMSNLEKEFNKQKDLKKQESDDKLDYDDDFEQDIEEDLPEDVDDPLANDIDGNEKSANVAITVSQSLGVDPSVDSLALEDYDHVEPVERIA